MKAFNERFAEPPPPGTFYRIMHALPRRVWPLFGGLTAQGVDNIPATGPFLLISNHQSMLDPFFIQTVCPRPCHAMAKSTQFGSPIMRAIMLRCYAFPVRRHRVDPQAVRFVLRRLGQGHPIHIYVEGERTWDGRLQQPRPGTVKLALKAGVPIVPCAIDGAYDIWPRWHRKAVRGRVRVAFGRPIEFGRHDTREERDAALPAAARTIIEAIHHLLPDSPALVESTERTFTNLPGTVQ
jgi:1-acyl-sn-glycerol-3-phosphate acyltransferase